jgi:lipoyl(octanoyl) transferase
VTIKFLEYGITPYSLALIDMDIALEAVQDGANECVFIMEHNALYSAGRSFVHSDFTGCINIPIYYPKRGGRVTVHSLGQLIIYPIINLKHRNINISEYIHMLEMWIIRVLKNFQIDAFCSDKGRGIWTSFGKIGFIGIGISKGVSYHGVCLNISNDLSLFNSIIPCGINNIQITSIKEIFSNKINMQIVIQNLVKSSPF